MPRLLKIIGESGVWKLIGRLHTVVFRATRGRIGASGGGLTHLLLTTTGRRTGEPRTVALAYMPDGEMFIVVASNGGADRHPQWWLNLQDDPHARVELASKTFDVVASRAEGAEHARLWPAVKRYNPFYGRYEQITEREIPVVILRPVLPH